MCSLIGIIALYYISENSVVSNKNIGKITLDDVNKNIKVEGIVKVLFENDKVTILTIEQPQETKVVMFKSKNESIGIFEGNKIEVIGKIDEYEGNLEVIADRVRVIS